MSTARLAETPTEQRRLLMDTLALRPGMRRKELLEACIDQYGFSAGELSDFGANSPVVQAKAELGTLLSELIAAENILEGETGRLTPAHSAKTVVAQDAAAEFILDYLHGRPETAKRQIYKAAEPALGLSDNASQEEISRLHSVVGQTLSRLEREKRVRRMENGYILPPHSAFPNTEIGYYLRQAGEGADLQDCFLKAIHVKGGEWFESYAVQLLKQYYMSCGKTVENAYVTGGSNDGGIDGVLEFSDWLGFRERTLMQMKNRHSQVPLKEVLEFYGAVCADNGTRGLFVTISTFHSEAAKLLNKVDNLIGIDGSKLFQIANHCGYGVAEREGRMTLDAKVFLRAAP